MALIMQSDKLVIGKVRTTEFLGIYFFGYQLIHGVARPFVSSLNQVLMPTLSYLTELSITASNRRTDREDVTRSLTVGPGCGMMVTTVDIDLSHYR